jgi:murein DD-endopeptidase MepM/ murein hydrolase activator NlpD
MVFRNPKSLAIATFALFLLAAGQASAISSGGGLVVPGVAKISNVTCVSGCNAIRESSPGGTVQITGSRLGSVSAVRFAARKGFVSGKPISATATRLQVRVPKAAVTGRVRLQSGTGSVSAPSAVVLAIGPVPDPAPSPLRLTDASTTPRVAYQYGARLPTLNFVVAGGRARNDLRIDIVSASGDVIASRIRKGVARGSAQRVAWSGKRGRRPAPNGRYRFVVRSTDGTAAVIPKSLTRTRRTGDPFGFSLYGFMFPVRGSHSYGDGVGAGRGHQGQDVLASCGTPLVAARGGVVYYNDYQAGGAGHYLVINTYGTGGKSQVYMHMPRPSRFKVGSRVKTGQRIGVVGSTGRSTACHLHFEEWSSPGWYQGGTFLSPTALLKRWDRYS